MKILFDKLSDAYAKFYIPSEHLAVDEVTVLFKDRVILKHYIPKKHECFGINVYKICNITNYTCHIIYTWVRTGKMQHR